MYKKRIGNDIRVLALIRQRIEGGLSPFDMRGRDISVSLVNPRGIETKIAEFDVTGDDGSILAFSYYGRDQKVIGVYTIVVRENDKEVGMRTVDKDACFELVKHSYQENIENDGVITIEALEIAMDMAIGTKGDKGDKGEKGPKGDKMTYADLTESDKADLYEGGASLVRPLLDGKQDTISDLDVIRRGAEKGSTALQSESDPIYTADKPNLALKSELNGKVDKEEGKGLSSNDYTNEEKAKLSELESKVDELENGEKQVLTFLRGSTAIPCDFKQGHIYKCTFARYIPYASESPRPMKVTLKGDDVTNSYIPTENGANLNYGHTYYYVSPNNYTSVNSYSDGTSEWDVYDITEQSEDVLQMMREAEFAPNGDAQYDSLGNIIQQSVLWSNGCSGVLVRSLFNEDSFEFNKEEVTCINAVGGVLSYKVTFENEFDDYGNIVSKNITISKI